MLDEDEATTWSKERVQAEIQERYSEIQELEEAIRFHEEMYERNPEQGFQGNDLYGFINDKRSEIAYLKTLL